MGKLLKAIVFATLVFLAFFTIETFWERGGYTYYEVSGENIESYQKVQLTNLPACDCESNYVGDYRYQEWYATSGSMLPNMRPGEHFISDYQYPFKDIKVGDIIAFRVEKDSVAITHRVIRIEKDEYRKTYLVTKGDNNEYEDPWRIYPVRYYGKLLCKVRK